MCIVYTAMFHFLLRKVFETYQVHYTILLIYRFLIHFYSSSTFPIFLKSLNNYFFSNGLLTSLFLQNFSVIINYTMWSPNLFFSFFFFASSSFLRFSRTRFSRVQPFQDPGFSGSGSMVRVQGLGLGFRSSQCKATLLKSHFCMGALLYICGMFSELFLIRSPSRGLLGNL